MINASLYHRDQLKRDYLNSFVINYLINQFCRKIEKRFVIVIQRLLFINDLITYVYFIYFSLSFNASFTFSLN